MNEDNGWIKIFRKITQSKYYLCGEKFPRAMCWIDLLLTAEWRQERVFYKRGNKVKVCRGQVALSLEDLSERWGLAVNTVRKRLKEMVDDERISVQRSNIVNIITILNYEKYQGFDTQDDTQNDMQIDTQTDVQKSAITSSAPPMAEVIAEEVEHTEQTPPVSVVELVDTPPVPLTKAAKKQEVDCEFIVRLFHDKCPSYPKVLKLSDKRRTKIRVRFEEMGFNYETLQLVFEKAEASRFMRGDNSRGWKADFDWIFSNGTNWIKILECKYDNKDTIVTPITKQNNGTQLTPVSTQPQYGGGSQTSTASQRQRMSVVATLAKITEQEGRGTLPTGFGSEGEL